MPYAIHVAGELVTIPPGQPFVSSQLRVAVDEAEHYEADAGAIIELALTHPGPVEAMTEADLDRYQIQWVAMTLDDARTQQLAAAAAAYDDRRQSPMAWDFGATEARDDAGVSHGAAGAQTLQMRDTPVQDDLKNWLAVSQGAAIAVMGGAPNTLVRLKTTANLWVQTTAAQVLQVLVTGDGTQVSALARGEAMLGHYGALKLQIAEAADAAAVLAIDVTAGWPA